MKMKKYTPISFLLFGLMFFNVDLVIAQESVIAPPDVKFVDEFGVNIVTRQVTASVDTVSIGGSLGLSHSISGETNLLSHVGNYGYIDSYHGSARYTMIGLDETRFERNGTTYYNRPVYVMRVFGPPGSQDFLVTQNGNDVVDGSYLTAPHAYRPLGDTRHSLEISSDRTQLIWTTDDGTKVYYVGQHSDAGDGGILRKIEYPTGFVVNIEVGGVSTNTGYVLKYIYNGHGSNLNSEKQQSYNQMPDNDIPIIDSGWNRNPNKIVGVNRSSQVCLLEGNGACDTNDWPMATFDWPEGMPRAIYIGSSVFYVTDQHNRVTRFHYRAQNACLLDLNDPGSLAEECADGLIRWAPRMVGIQSANSNRIDRQFTYKNDYKAAGSDYQFFLNDFDRGGIRGFESGEDVIGWGFSYWQLHSKSGLINKVESPQGEGSYSNSVGYNDPGRTDPVFTGSTGSVIMNGRVTGKVLSVNLLKTGKYRFHDDYRNFVSSFEPVSGPPRSYHYDTRGNLERITEGATSGGGSRFLEADYPDTCNNRKACNKPQWTKDFKGNRTDYTYNNSGQVLTITGPADRNGIRPQTRYTYTNLYAYYKKNSDAVEQADNPVSLLTREASCRTTAASGNGCAGGASDEVVTQYYYGPQNDTPNNLLLRGVSVTAEGDNGIEIRVTCYEYDKYGHRIGETLPEGNVGFNNANQCP